MAGEMLPQSAMAYEDLWTSEIKLARHVQLVQAQIATVAWPHLGRQDSNFRLEGCLALVKLLTSLGQSR